MFGFLIFIIAKEISCTTAYIYSQKDHQSTFAPSELGFPCVSFFPFLPLSLQLILWSIETCRAHSPALASKTPLERAPCAFVSNESPVSRSLLVLCINQGISASFSLSLPYRHLWTIRFRSTKGPQQSPLTDGRYRKKGLSGLHEVCCRRNILCCLEPLRFSDLLITAAQLALLVNIVTKPNLGPLVQLTVKSIY